jgi:hypothetical protein
MSEIGDMHLSADQLLDLVQGLLSGPERAGLLRHLKSCRACEERFRSAGREVQLLKIRAARVATTPALPAIDRAGPLWKRWSGPRIAAAALAAGAAVLIVATSWTLLRNTSRQRDDLDYWLPVVGEEVMLRSRPAAAESGPLLEAVEAYGRHDSARVVELLANRDLSQYAPLRLILASALVWQGRNTEARDLLIRWEVHLLPQPHRDRARWILYVARKRAGEETEAEAIARDLTSRPGEFAERARRALARAPAPASP